MFVASCGTLQTHFHEKGPCGEMHLFASTFLVKKRFRKIRRFFLNLKIKKKDSADIARAQAEPTAACGGNREARLGQRPAGCKARPRAAADAGAATRQRRPFQMVSSSSKVIPSSVVPKFAESVCAESSDLSIAFLARRGYNQTIDSNGAVGHLLTRSAVFVKKSFVLWGPLSGSSGAGAGKHKIK